VAQETTKSTSWVRTSSSIVELAALCEVTGQGDGDHNSAVGSESVFDRKRQIGRICWEGYTSLNVEFDLKRTTRQRLHGMLISERLANLDWSAIHASLNDRGFALTARILNQPECEELVQLYPRDHLFRSHIIMSRYRFGRGDYKYFKYPLPPSSRKCVFGAIQSSCPSPPSGVKTYVSGNSFPKAIRLFSSFVKSMLKSALRLFCFTQKMAILMACIGLSTAH